MNIEFKQQTGDGLFADLQVPDAQLGIWDLFMYTVFHPVQTLKALWNVVWAFVVQLRWMDGCWLIFDLFLSVPLFLWFLVFAVGSTLCNSSRTQAVLKFEVGRVSFLPKRTLVTPRTSLVRLVLMIYSITDALVGVLFHSTLSDATGWTQYCVVVLSFFCNAAGLSVF